MYLFIYSNALYQLPDILSFEIKSYNKLSHFHSCPDVNAGMNKTKIPLVPLSCKDWFQAWQGQIEMYLSRNATLRREPSRVKFNFYNFNTHI